MTSTFTINICNKVTPGRKSDEFGLRPPIMQKTIQLKMFPLIVACVAPVSHIPLHCYPRSMLRYLVCRSPTNQRADAELTTFCRRHVVAFSKFRLTGRFVQVRRKIRLNATHVGVRTVTTMV